MTNQEIIDAGQVIFDEESVGANTSERVGAVIKGIGQNLIAEENARTSADTALGHRIDDEETARLAAESGLGGEIDAEIAARREADTSLGARIDREASARVAADAALGERIDGLSGDLDDEVRAREDAMSAEEAARQSGDDNLGDAIGAETAARQQADTALDGRIDTEKAAREAADTALGGRIDTEKSAREAADTALGERIDDLSDGLDDEAEMRAAAINDEKSAREQADIALGARIDAEKAAREAADGELDTRITGLSDGLAAEVSAREAAVAAETAAREAVANAVETLGNVNYLLAGCKGNMFDKNYVRIGKGISAAGGIVDEVGGCISCYYKIPDEAEVLHIDGAVGSYMRLRLTSEPSDDVVNTEAPAETNVYVLSLINGSAEVYLPTFRLTYPNLKYFCVNVYRGGDDSGLDDFSIVFSPKTLQDVEKTTTLLEKAVSVTVPVNWRLGVVNAQGEHTTTSGDYYMSDYIPVEQGNVYEVTVSGGYGVRVVSFYTSKSSTGYIENSAIPGAPQGGGIVSKTVRVTAPDGARYMKIVKNTSSSVLPLIPDTAYGARSVGNLNGLLGENMAVNWKKGYISASDNAITSGTTYEYSDLLEVSAGDSFIVGIGGSNVTVGVLFYDGQQTAIEDGRVVNNNQYRQLLVTAPETAKYMRVCHNIANGEYRIYKPSYVFKTAIESKGGTNAGTGRYWLKERMKYGFFDNTKKPCIVFEMDINQVSDRSDNTQAFVDKLKEIGAAPTFLIMPKRFRLDVVVQKMQNYVSQGVEIAIHTEPEDGIGSQNPEPHPTIAQFKTIMEDEVTRDVGGTTVTYPGYIPTFLASGFYPLGLVVSNSQTYTPEGGGYPYGDYLIYAHTLFGGRHGDNVSNFINTQATDRMEIKRWQIENHNQTEADILQDFKNAVDYIKQNNGIFVVYCHTYNEEVGEDGYTLPQTLFESMVDYIKSDVFEQKIIVGTMADVVKYYYDR